MKKALSLTAIAAAVLLSLPAVAADTQPIKPSKTAMATAPVSPATPATAEKVPAPKSALSIAADAMGAELKAVFGETMTGSPIPYLDKLVDFSYSSETKDKIAAAFGTSEPYTFKHVPAEGGLLGYQLAGPANPGVEVEGNQRLSWSAFTADVVLDKAGREMQSKGSMAQASVRGKGFQMSANNLSFSAKQHRVGDNLWLGSMEGAIESILAGPDNGGPGVTMENLSLTASVTQHGTDMDVRYNTGIKAIKAAGVQIDDVRMVMRLANLDYAGMEKWSKQFKNNPHMKLSEAQQKAMVASLFKSMGKSASTHGTSFEIDEISAGFLNNRAVVKGKVSVGKITDADLVSAEAYAKKLIVRLQVTVPVAMITDVSKAFLAKDAEAKKQPMSEEALAQAGQSVSDMLVGKVLTSGYAKLENGVIVSQIDFKGGKLSINGKDVPLPSTAAKPVAAKSKH
ncbi:MAG: DUF945 family protein [Massilia sp.]